MEPEGSLPYSQEHATGPCVEPVYSSAHLTPHFSELHVWAINIYVDLNAGC